MQSDVSVLTCTPQNTPQRLPHFILGLKKEPNHLPTCVVDGSADVKNVFLSHLGTKPSDFYSSSLLQPETHKVHLDSVDTLLRNKSYVEPPSNPDSDLNELLQIVSERSCFTDEKPLTESTNSFWLPNPPSPAISMVKHEESLKSTKLPTVDQIMKFHSRNASTSAGVLFSTPSSSSLTEPPFEHSLQFPSSASSENFASCAVTAPQSMLSSLDSSEITSKLSCKPLQLPSSVPHAPPQSKYGSGPASVSVSCQVPSHQWRPIIASDTPVTTPTKETEPSSQKSQPRFILPNTSRPPFEVSLAKQTLLVPINNPSSGAGSLLLLPLAVAAALQHQKQQQQQMPPSTALLTSLPGTGVSGTTQFLLIRAADAPKTTPVGIIPSNKNDVTLPIVTTSSTKLVSIPSKSETLSPRLPLPPSSTMASTPAIVTSVKPLAPAVLPPAVEILPAPSFAKPVTPSKHRFSSEESNTVVSAVVAAVSTLRRRHQCPFCTKSCERKDNLQAHIRTHTGERPFPCRFCPKAFPQKDHLRAHIRTHTGEKPYRCPQCSKAFAQLGNLHRHVKTHRQ
ncbi:Zinc finger and SCAN domain-containing protein 5B [Echinococcus granulosus]|uniref:Zinc finger and SCAN domain-containing protein 5B n=1 Tax=Echinococcus granulosus TaxID=6210 RepID=W6U7I3_ECHGR|nr:Zinc finger and SCAN domain-containing protein 5B [Echinococcus granulosus]EUB57193.1 Zinc finger and SCAN domain-containing protein 5B [Echinococcus granulosus]